VVADSLVDHLTAEGHAHPPLPAACLGRAFLLVHSSPLQAEYRTPQAYQRKGSSPGCDTIATDMNLLFRGGK
jgi:hypothetical protein